MEGVIQQIRSYLPQFYKDKLPEELLNTPWEEINKCSSCIMTCGDNPKYNKVTKCCTYYPFIPNYMVGNILVNNKLKAHIVLEYINSKKFTLPVGLCTPEDYQLKYVTKKDWEFGNNEELQCPFYDSGDCTVWDQRSAECLSFQCYSSYGSKGLKMWKYLGDLVYEIEIHLSQKMMTAHNFPEQAVAKSIEFIKYEHYSPKRKDKHYLTDKEWSEYWLNHSEDVAEYYISCYKKSLELDLKPFITKLSDYSKVMSILN